MDDKAWITGEITVDQMIKELLYDENKEKLEFELNGYPPDILDDPQQKRMKTESYNHLIDGEDYIGFKLITMTDEEFTVSDLFSADKSHYDLSFKGKKFSIPAIRLRKLLYKAGDGVVKTYSRGDGFYLRLKVKQLLEYLK